MQPDDASLPDWVWQAADAIADPAIPWHDPDTVTRALGRIGEGARKAVIDQAAASLAVVADQWDRDFPDEASVWRHGGAMLALHAVAVRDLPPNEAASWAWLALRALRERYEAGLAGNDDRALLEHAISLAASAVEARPVNGATWLALDEGLLAASALHDTTGDDRSLLVLRDHVRNLGTDRSRVRGPRAAVVQLAAELLAYRATRAPEDLSRAVALGTSARRRARSGPLAARARHLHGRALDFAFTASGRSSDLDRAITAFRNALARAADSPRLQTFALHSLGISLASRHQATRDAEALDAAMAMFGRGLAILPSRHPDRPRQLGNVASLLSTRYDLRGDPADLDRALALEEEALALTPADSTGRALRLGNLANRLSTRHDLRGDPADLDRALALEEEALALTPTDSTDRALRLGNLASSLSTRYRLRGDPADLDRALALTEEAWDIARRSGTGLSAVDAAWRLASRLRTRDHLTGSPSGSSASRQATVLDHALAILDGILARAGIADERTADTLLARYGHLHAWLVGSLLTLANDARDAGDATSASSHARSAYDAVARAKGRRLAARLHAGALAPGATTTPLVAELDRLGAELDHLERQLGGEASRIAPGAGDDVGSPRLAPASRLSPPLSPDRLDALRTAHGRASLRQASLLRDVQALDPRWATARGTASPPSPEEVAASLPPDGAALLLFPLEDNTVALTIRNHAGASTSVTLDTLPWPRRDLDHLISTALDRLAGTGDGFVLDTLLHRLATHLVPVISRAFPTATPGNVPPTLILMPTGALHRIPLHAIPWPSPDGQPSSSSRLADVARVSYAATPDVLVLRAREASRDASAQPPASPPINPAGIATVAPGLADAPGAHVPDLTVALALATADLPGARVATRSLASRHAVLAGASLAGASLALVATHGRAGGPDGGPDGALRSGLLLHSGQLPTILDGSPDARADASDTDASWVSARELLARLPLDGTRHVQLLACSTHADDPAPGDELAGLISAFLVRGAASVAGTLWPVNELPACLVGWWIASATASGASPASAFHDAITRLRHATPSTITATLLELRPASATDPHARDAVDRSLASLASLHPHSQPFSHPAHWAPYVLHGSPR